MQQGFHWDMLAKVNDMRKTAVICPAQHRILYAMEITPFEIVKVVIIGQDPYHTPGMATGLAFGTNANKMPPSLRNIVSEADEDVGVVTTGIDLEHWARQGVLLLNAVLTVESGKAGSHNKLGWQKLTDDIVRTVNERRRNVVFHLWGKVAQVKDPLMNMRNHLVIKAPHPSPLSAYRGWFGSKVFSKTNEYLIATGQEPIQW